MFDFLNARRITHLEKCVSQLTKDLNRVQEDQVFIEEEITAVKEDAFLCEEKVTELIQFLEAIRDKLHANCILTGDLRNEPKNCLRDRVSKLEGMQGVYSIDVDQKELNTSIKKEISNMKSLIIGDVTDSQIRHLKEE